MRVWFTNISTLLGAEDPGQSALRQIVEAAAARRALVGLSKDSALVRPHPEFGALDAVDGDDLIVRASHGERPWLRALVPGETIHIAIAATRGFYSGETQVVSRWWGRDIGLDRCGCRVRIPVSMLHSQGVSSEPMPVAFDLATRAKVRAADLSATIGSGLTLDPWTNDPNPSVPSENLACSATGAKSTDRA